MKKLLAMVTAVLLNVGCVPAASVASEGVLSAEARRACGMPGSVKWDQRGLVRDGKTYELSYHFVLHDEQVKILIPEEWFCKIMDEKPEYAEAQKSWILTRSELVSFVCRCIQDMALESVNTASMQYTTRNDLVYGITRKQWACEVRDGRGNVVAYAPVDINDSDGNYKRIMAEIFGRLVVELERRLDLGFTYFGEFDLQSLKRLIKETILHTCKGILEVEEAIGRAALIWLSESERLEQKRLRELGIDTGRPVLE